MPDMDKLELTFTHAYDTEKKSRYDEDVGEYEYSAKGPAIGYLYPFKDAMEMIGSPKKIKVTIEPA